MTKIGWVNFIADILLFTLIIYILPLGVDHQIRIILFYALVQLMVGRYRNNVLLVWDEVRLILKSHGWFYLGSLLFIQGEFVTRALWLAVLTLIAGVYSFLAANYSRIWFHKAFTKNVLVIGMGNTAEKLKHVVEENSFSLMKIKGFINCNNSKYLPRAYQQEEVIKENVYPLDRIHEIIKRENISSIIIAIPQLEKGDLKTIMDMIRDSVKEIKVLPRFENLVTFDSRVDDFDGLLMISTAQRILPVWAKVFKRVLDICGGIAGCILLIPVYFYVRHKNHQANDYDPVIFKQKRIGKNGKEFTIYKFRTMVPNAEQILQELMEKDPAIREEYKINKKLKDDPRITEAGKFLRKTSLDEFPQLINVLRGEMSLIGPRPYLLGEKEDMGIFYDIVIKMKPGITGMWQTHGRSDVDFQDRLALDEYYYRNYNLWLDVTLLVKTLMTVMSGRDKTAR